jgi:hypothetical protein
MTVRCITARDVLNTSRKEPVWFYEPVLRIGFSRSGKALERPTCPDNPDRANQAPAMTQWRVLPPQQPFEQLPDVTYE